jgi:hypothetical protein
MQRITLVITIIIAACHASLAAPAVFQDHNFSIEFPSDWQILNPPPDQTLAAAQTIDGLKTLLVIAAKLPASELSAASRDMIAGAKQSAIDKGWQITNEHETSVSGVPFHAFTTRVSARASIITYVGLAGDEGYMLQGMCKESDASSDAEVTGAINSFRLLSPRNPPAETSRPNSTAYRTGYIFGQVLFLAIIGTGIVWVIRWVKNKRGKV